MSLTLYELWAIFMIKKSSFLWKESWFLGLEIWTRFLYFMRGADSAKLSRNFADLLDYFAKLEFYFADFNNYFAKTPIYFAKQLFRSFFNNCPGLNLAVLPGDLALLEGGGISPS